MSIATNGNKKENIFKQVTILNISLQLWWRHLMYRHMGCSAMSQLTNALLRFWQRTSRKKEY
jgi:hypothetical protein